MQKKFLLIFLFVFCGLVFLPAQKNVSISDDPQLKVSDSLASVVGRFYQIGNLDSAIYYAKECSKIEAAVLGKNHIYYANSLFNIGYFYLETKKPCEALPYLQNALSIYNENNNDSLIENTYNVFVSSLAQALDTLINQDAYPLLVSMIDTLCTLPYIKEVEVIGLRRYQHFCLDMIISTSLQKNTYTIIPDAVGKNLHICREVFGEISNEYLEAIHLAYLYHKQVNEHKEALYYSQIEANLKDQLLGEKDREYYESLMSLAYAQLANGQIELAKENAEKAQKYMETFAVPNTSWQVDYALRVIECLASCYDHLANESNSVTVKFENNIMAYSLRVCSKAIMDKEQVYRINPLYNCGVSMISMGELDNAIDAFQKVDSLFHEGNDYDVNTYHLNLLWLAVGVYMKEGDASCLLNRVFLETQTYFNNHFAYSTYLQRYSLNMNALYEISKVLFGQIMELSSDSLNRLAFDYVLYTKGVLLNRDFQFSQYYQNQTDTSLYQTYTTWAKEEMGNKKDSLERVLINASSNNREVPQEIRLKDIANRLEGNDVLIEFYSTKYMNRKKEFIPSVFALILRKDWKSPRILRFGENVFADNTKHNLYRDVWSQIIHCANIRKGEKIYFAPDGIVCAVPIEYVFTEENVPINEEYNISRIASSRSLFESNSSCRYKKAVLYGGLNYDLKVDDMLTQSMKYSTKSCNRDAYFSNVIKNGDIRATYTYLPYSEKEIEKIQKVFNAKYIPVTVYTGSTGNEESFKSLSGQSPSVLHLATHGFYITPSEVEVASQDFLSRMNVGSKSDELYVDYSMSRTGLLLSGAMARIKGDSIPEGVEDGILSAKEISYLDLSNTDLVVLSACNTGLGDITNDGVAGLQRGFKMAGVKTIMMSLWPVDDAATYLLMTEFYRNYLGGETKTKSLREAQRYLRNYKQNGEKIFANPKYWAAFVLLDALD